MRATPNIRRRKNSLRARGWDYSGPGRYFITICAKDHTHFFGHIRNGVIHHSEIGAIAHRCWADIQMHYPNARLGEFVIMPNHMHGILILTGDDRFRTNPSATSHIIRMYKGIVTKMSTCIDPSFKWHRNYHDIIIRDNRAFNIISNYIRNNPKKWEKDRFRRQLRK